MGVELNPQMEFKASNEYHVTFDMSEGLTLEIDATTVKAKQRQKQASNENMKILDQPKQTGTMSSEEILLVPGGTNKKEKKVTQLKSNQATCNMSEGLREYSKG